MVASALAIDLWVWGGDTETWLGQTAPAWVIVVALVAGHACLAVWRSPIRGYAALWVLSFGALIVPAVETFAGFLVALFLMARMTPRPVAAMALLGSAAPIIINSVTGVSFHEDASTFFYLANAGLWALLMFLAWGAGRAWGRSERRLATEQQWAEEKREEALSIERLRISREIHDSVAHGLSGIVLQAAGARAALKRGAASEKDLEGALSSIQKTGEQGMRELHLLLGMLREEQERGRDAAGVDQIMRMVEDAREIGLDVSLDQSGEPVELDPSIARAAYRVVQEALSNVMKHAGAGANVAATITWLPSRMIVAVRNTRGIVDPSVTTEALSGGFGLEGLRERLTVVEGELEAGPTGDGFLVRASLPITNDREATQSEERANS